jgi:adenylate cyclase
MAEPIHDPLKALLHAYNERPDSRAQTVARIEQEFQRTIGILVLDSSGFTRTVRRSGIVHFLAMLERLQRTVQPIVRHNRGRIRRTEADNIFAIFDTANDAVAAAEAISQMIRIVNDALPEDDELYVSIGVGYGPTLLVGDKDMYGNELTLTFKLGEDLAEREQVLVTPQAYAALGETHWTFVEELYSVVGIEVRAYRLKEEEDN